MIEVSHLTFDYMTRRALDDVSFSVEGGAIVALIGPNGAGKTTLMRCLAGLMRPFSGSISVGGIDVVENPRQSHKHISYLPDVFGLYDRLTARQGLEYAALSHGIAPAMADERAEETAEMLGLTAHLDTLAGNLSRGLRQRLAIAACVIHRPSLIILDEPASGLDPKARLDLSRVFVRLASQGHTLIVSSHILAELEDYATDVMLLRGGKLAKAWKTEAREPAVPVRVRVLSGVAGAMKLLRGLGGVSGVKSGGGGGVIHAKVSGGDSEVAAVLEKLVSGGAQVVQFAAASGAMSDAYFATAED